MDDYSRGYNEGMDEAWKDYFNNFFKMKHYKSFYPRKENKYFAMTTKDGLFFYYSHGDIWTTLYVNKKQTEQLESGGDGSKRYRKRYLFFWGKWKDISSEDFDKYFDKFYKEWTTKAN